MRPRKSDYCPVYSLADVSCLSRNDFVDESAWLDGDRKALVDIILRPPRSISSDGSLLTNADVGVKISSQGQNSS